MHRFSTLMVILAIVLVGFGLPGSAPRAVAQEATPATGTSRCPSPLAPPIAASLATPTTAPVCVGVIEGDYYIRPELTTFQVGQTYIFAIGNEGRDLHEFVIEPAGSEEEAALEADENGEEREAEVEISLRDSRRNWSGRSLSRATSSSPATWWTTTNEGW